MISDFVKIEDMTPYEMECDLKSMGYDEDTLDLMSDREIIELFLKWFGYMN